MEELTQIILRIASIILITFLPCAGLLMVYFYTAPKIAEYYDIKEKRAVLDIFKLPYRTIEKRLLGFTLKSFDKKDIREVFKKNITIKKYHVPTKLTEDPLFDTVERKCNGGKRLYKFV